MKEICHIGQDPRVILQEIHVSLVLNLLYSVGFTSCLFVFWLIQDIECRTILFSQEMSFVNNQ